MNRRASITTFFLLTFMLASAQERLILEHRKKTGKIKYINPRREYEVQTKDASYYSKITGFTDTSLFITGRVKTGRDTSYTYFDKRRKGKDTSYTVVSPIYKMDTIKILFTDISALKKDWIRNGGWLTIPASFAAGAVLGIVLLPFVAIDDGKEGVQNWAAFEGILIGLSAPTLFVGTRKTKYDLTKKWMLKVQK